MFHPRWGGDCAYEGTRNRWEISAPSAPFCHELKTALKREIYSKQKIRKDKIKRFCANEEDERKKLSIRCDTEPITSTHITFSHLKSKVREGEMETQIN